ncbi:hypothetical protein [Legionella taurinensis]|uniref:Uncharacterized protein n=1 Tax=Legionella taurinensis TaxID=70611 RepID=A0A3A5LFS7_9GAMM|nr:hypothetical protein [Legionella taurinensis]RJT45000.1 hypothetical protein D6J04_11810 [Legionella taurinensis]RJT65600.1 hypothetical protein D6J03_12455 [Legionella taurinensis]STY27225.1 Uncharacterised protein [Legionella taurinensis]
MTNLFQLFQSREVRYFPTVFTSRVSFKKQLQPKIHTSSKSLEAFLKLERELQPMLKTTNKELTIHLVRKTNDAFLKRHQIDLIMGNINLESIAMGVRMESGLTSFEHLYRADNELLSPSFNHVSTPNLRELKLAIVAQLGQKKLVEKVAVEKQAACQQLLTQTQHLIMSAKTVSAVIASVAYSARVFTALGVVTKGKLSDSAICNLFEEDIPAVFATQKLNTGTALNHVGSAFQLEKVREQLIVRLEDYLSRRARLLDEVVAENDHSGDVSQRYKAINRGFFYNKDLQEARVAIASRLLMQIERYQLCDREGTGTSVDNDRKAKNGHTIDTPQHFAQALIDAMEDNLDCFEKKARAVDQLGELHEILAEAREQMGVVYTQTVKVGGNYNLREQLGLEKVRQPAMTH